MPLWRLVRLEYGACGDSNHDWEQLKVVTDALMSGGWVEVVRWGGVGLTEAMDAGLTGKLVGMFGHWQIVGSL